MLARLTRAGCSAQRVQNLAYALIQAGIQPGDRVAIIAPNWYAGLTYNESVVHD